MILSSMEKLGNETFPWQYEFVRAVQRINEVGAMPVWREFALFHRFLRTPSVAGYRDIASWHAIVAMPSWPCHLGHAIVALPSRSWHRDAGIMTMWPARSRDRGESTFAGLDSMLWIQCSGFELGYVKAVPARRREDVSHRRREVRIDAF